MKIIARTERLILREFTLEDAKELYLLNSDKEVMKYTGDLPFNSVLEATDFLNQYSDYKENGMGRWAVVDKKESRFLGWCGLKKHSDNWVDLGFRFHKKFWNKGYATESSTVCIEVGFEQFELNEIIGRASQQNLASIRVLEKIGMKYWKKDECKGIENAIYYRIFNNQNLQK